MASSEKFCLRWNDFESNVSSAFRDIREEKDFFDVTLACDDDSQIQAHKVIIAACSPFFRNILRKNSHQHPLLYLKGVKYKELISVLNFMYQGEVNVAQDDLNSFLAVAEDLRVKGLTQGSGSADNSTSKQKSEPTKYPPPVRPRESQMPSEPPSKKSRAAPPEVASYDDDIQEVLPVKSEPGAAPTAGASHYDTQDQNQVALEEQYDESYDYGQYGEAYDDGSGMIDPNTGLPLQTADGNKGLEENLEALIRNTSDYWECLQCGKQAKTKQHIKYHAETHLGIKHICKQCGKFYKTTHSLSVHISQAHKFFTV